LEPYVPGKPIETLQRELGLSDVVKLASNENPLGPSPQATAAIQTALGRLHRYPDGAAHDLTDKLARQWDVAADNIVLGNGSDDLIAMIARAFLEPGDAVVVPKPSFLMYALAAQWSGARCVSVPLKVLTIDLDAMAEAVDPTVKIIFLCNPNNPTGTIFAKADFERFLDRVPMKIIVVLDEAYAEFVRGDDFASGAGYIDLKRPVVTLRTFSKAYGLAGLRVGYGIMPAEVAQVLHRVRDPFNVSIPAQAGALAALDDHKHLLETRRITHDGIVFLRDALADLGLTCFATEANFFLIDVKIDADQLYNKLLHEGVIVRSMRAYGYPNYIRISIGRPRENQRFIEALHKVLGKTG
jgi:histidinol-phosphate aminotransferase